MNRTIHFIKIVRGNDVIFYKLITEIEIYKCIVNKVDGYREEKRRAEVNEIHIKKDCLKSVGDNIDLCPKDGFLLESAGIKSIDKVADQMHCQADKIIFGIGFENCENEKIQRKYQP